MQRKKAVVLLKEISDKCPLLSGSVFSLVPPNTGRVLSKGYQVHIKDPVLDDHTKSFLKEIAEENHVAVKQERQLIVIYRPLSS